ncbi:MAG: SDR family oxidoreductase, partial [Bryocella sp.]
RSRAHVVTAVDDIVRRRGRIDILVNNAGIMRRAPFLDVEDQDWDEIIATNLTAYFIVSQVVARVMSQQGFGSIVNVSSTNDLIASRDCTPYAVAKGGVGMLTNRCTNPAICCVRCTKRKSMERRCCPIRRGRSFQVSGNAR